MTWPKSPVIALGVVVALWAWVRWQGHRSAQAITPIYGPVFELRPATEGAWQPTWPEWTEQRGRPYVAVYGRPFIGFDAHYDPLVFLRVHPRDAVEHESAIAMDADGWFEAGEDHNFSTVAWLQPRKVERIEYRVGTSTVNSANHAQLQIRGIGDLMVWKNIVVNTGLADSAALLVGFLLIVWLLIARGLRARRSRSPQRAAKVTS